MRYVLREKLFSWGDDFSVQDDEGRDVFFVDGAAFSIGNKLSFQDMRGKELAFIKQRLLSWGPSYEIHRNGELYATVKKELFTFFTTKFEVDIPGPHDIRVKGNFLDHEYEFVRVTDGACVATVSKSWLSVSDSYGVEVARGEDDVLLLSTAVVIDQVCHEPRD